MHEWTQCKAFTEKVIVIIEVCIKSKILSVETNLSEYMHTQAPAHTSILTTQNVKTWQVYCFGKGNVLRFDLEPREGLCRREKGEGHSMYK